MTNIKERITHKTKPCGCGCKGSDPWHKRSYKRVVRGVRTLDDGSQEGTVRLFGGKVRVVRELIFSFTYDEATDTITRKQLLYADGTPGLYPWCTDKDDACRVQNETYERQMGMN